MCDLICRFTEDNEGWVYRSISNRVLGGKSRYRSSVLGKTLPDVLKRLATPEMAFIELKIGTVREFFTEDGEVINRAQATTFRAGPRLVSRIGEFSLDTTDTLSNKIEETIILKAVKQDHTDTGKFIAYDDDEKTAQWRDDLQVINEWIAGADLELYQDGFNLGVMGKKRLRRVFNNGVFTQGGRLWGGFWQNVKKERRRNFLTINGEGVTELDFGQMSIKMLYGKAGVSLPEGDLYRVPNLNSREGVKKIINAALSSDKELTRMPQVTRKVFPELDQFSFEQIINAVM